MQFFSIKNSVLVKEDSNFYDMKFFYGDFQKNFTCPAFSSY